MNSNHWSSFRLIQNIQNRHSSADALRDDTNVAAVDPSFPGDSPHIAADAGDASSLTCQQHNLITCAVAKLMAQVPSPTTTSAQPQEKLRKVVSSMVPKDSRQEEIPRKRKVVSSSYSIQ